MGSYNVLYCLLLPVFCLLWTWCRAADHWLYFSSGEIGAWPPGNTRLVVRCVCARVCVRAAIGVPSTPGPGITFCLSIMCRLCFFTLQLCVTRKSFCLMSLCTNIFIMTKPSCFLLDHFVGFICSCDKSSLFKSVLKFCKQTKTYRIYKSIV